ncbi:MAG: transcription termination factor NusA [Elusimicrobia bacterium RIFCSPLOWO2_01_FULL_54_10]|nr:MAG: transcription termination factor NusA [Elusimicrobia bacterium RIFCSPLOWO2_01_FULL_54_10]
MTTQKNSLIPVLEQIERDKGVKKDEIIKMIESSLVSAYRKHYGKIMNVIATIDPETAEIKAFLVKKVVETVQNPSEEISVEEAKALKLKGKVDEEVQIPIATEEFSRIAAQIAKQIIVQKIREVERTSLFEEFSGKESTLASGSVHRFAERNMIIDLGKAEAILPVREQVRRERFNLGERLKILVLKVEKGSRGPQILVSRSHPDLVKKLLEFEVPEIADKIVEVLNVVRDAGFRSKVLVRSHNPKVDPVGTCVGVKGSRIRPIIDELRGERIDLISWHPETEKLIAGSLSPAKVLSVSLIKDTKTAEVLVSNDMYLLAIGRNGQNARLASLLTGWNIEVKSEQQRKEDSAKNVETALKEISVLDGVGPKIADVLIKGGWTSAARLAQASVEQLTALQGIGEKTAEKIIESAKAVMTERAGGAPAPKNEEVSGETPDITPEEAVEEPGVEEMPSAEGLEKQEPQAEEVAEDAPQEKGE